MTDHICNFTIARLQAKYRGADFKIDECEVCGNMQLVSELQDCVRRVSPNSSEFVEVLEFFECVIKAAHSGVQTDYR